MNMNTGGGLIGLLILIGDIWAIINILQSNAGMGAKLLWILLVVLLPLLGLIIWFVAGPRGGKAKKVLHGLPGKSFLIFMKKNSLSR